jgi:hypothetical protein
MDFVHDALADGRQFRVLTVVDQWSRQSPILEVASSLSGVTVGVALDRVLPQAHALRSITWITALNLCPVPWKIGRISVACNWISFHQGNPWKMRSSNRLSGGCGMSV